MNQCVIVNGVVAFTYFSNGRVFDKFDEVVTYDSWVDYVTDVYGSEHPLVAKTASASI